LTISSFDGRRLSRRVGDGATGDTILVEVAALIVDLLGRQSWRICWANRAGGITSCTSKIRRCGAFRSACCGRNAVRFNAEVLRRAIEPIRGDAIEQIRGNTADLACKTMARPKFARSGTRKSESRNHTLRCENSSSRI